MKKIFLCLTVAIASMASAQVLNVVSMERLSVPAPIQDARVAAISPTGDFILLTNNASQGLTRYDLNTSSITVLSTAMRAGLDAVISEDGQDVLFRESIINANHEWSESVILTHMPSMERKVVAAPSASLISVSPRLLPRKSNRMSQPEVSVNHDLQIVVNVNGQTRILTPQGENMSYIWAVLSPDQTLISYYCSEIGGFVCDLNGNVVASLGRHCKAAKWLDDNTLVGHETQDDGFDFTAAQITACTLDGRFQRLTDNSMKAMYPVAGGDKIAFSNLNGEVYLMTVSK